MFKAFVKGIFKTTGTLCVLGIGMFIYTKINPMFIQIKECKFQEGIETETQTQESKFQEGIDYEIDEIEETQEESQEEIIESQDETKEEESQDFKKLFTF
jgi:hypothetical protein